MALAKVEIQPPTILFWRNSCMGLNLAVEAHVIVEIDVLLADSFCLGRDSIAGIFAPEMSG
jgi:hypothetical protein